MKVLAQNRTRAFDKKAVVKCAAAVALLIAASKVSFAIGPVPLTMQTFAVAVVGAWLGTRQGVAAVVAYLALGFAGLPVFATPLCGPAALMGPTAGWLKEAGQASVFLPPSSISTLPTFLLFSLERFGFLPPSV